jgi:hypothetical protein
LGNGTFAQSNTPVQVLGPGGVGHLSGVTSIAGVGFHSLALKSDGTVWAWGANDYGELGNGTFAQSNTPVQVLGPGGVGFLTGVTAIAGGGFHSLALKSDGTVWAWGDDFYGQLGNGTNRTDLPYGIATPVQVLGSGGVGYITGVTAIAGGFFHSLALKSDGTVGAWGADFAGQLGNGTYTTTPPYGIATPVQVLGSGGVGYITGVTAIAGGFYHNLALKNDGTVWTWGLNGNGQLGNTFPNSNTPVQVVDPGGVGYLTGVTAIAGGGFHSLALKSEGTVRAWGHDFAGQLGNGTYTTTPPYGIATPVQVLGPGGVGYLTGMTAIAGGAFHSLALKAATPSQLINSLIGQVMSLGLSHGKTTSLTAKLHAALGYLQAGDTADAIAALQAFIHEVNALVNSGRMTAAAASPLISAAEGIIAAF